MNTRKGAIGLREIIYIVIGLVVLLLLVILISKGFSDSQTSIIDSTNPNSLDDYVNNNLDQKEKLLFIITTKNNYEEEILC